MNKITITVTLFLFSLFVNAQVGIGTTTPQGTLDIVSTNDTGVVIPRVSSIDNVTDGQGNPPANGTLVYDISKDAICFYLNGNWACMEFNSNGSVGLNDPNVIDYEGEATYIKASSSNSGVFGYAIALSADGNTLAVGAIGDSSNATGINGNQTDTTAAFSGAVFLFTRSGTTWSQQAYIKASNTNADDTFGEKLSLSADGNTLAVSTIWEDSNATGVNGNQADNSTNSSGAVYVFSRSGTAWSQQAYIKASNTDTEDRFGGSLSLSADGNTLAVGAIGEGSNATGINGNQTDNSANFSGAAYVFTRSGTVWLQQAYIKASNTDANDSFGRSLSLSADGNTLAVGATGEGSNATGINGNQADNSANGSGTAYVFTRSGTVWSQQAYIKASNTDANDSFGRSLSLSADGNTLAVSATGEDSNATVINGNQTDNSANGSGAAYVFTRSGTVWSQQAYIKAPNTDSFDRFGLSTSLSADGTILAIGTYFEDSNATGINGTQADNSANNSGAAYVFRRSGTVWLQQAYIKASNTDINDYFGYSLSLSANGNTLAIGAYFEDSNATGIGGDQTNNAASNSGAVYMYEN